MNETLTETIRAKLQSQKEVLEQRLERIGESHRRPLESDSKERAAQLENQEVVDALGNEARLELRQISAALARIETGEYGICDECGDPIGEDRLLVYPHADKCIECATLEAGRNSIRRAQR